MVGELEGVIEEPEKEKERLSAQKPPRADERGHPLSQPLAD